MTPFDYVLTPGAIVFYILTIYVFYSITKKSRNLVKLEKCIDEIKIGKTKLNSWQTIEKQWQEEELWDKAHPIQAYVKNIYYSVRRFFYEIPELPRYGYRKIKRGAQRAYFGICSEDHWALAHYLSKVILQGLKDLQKNRTSLFRTGNTGDPDKDYDEAQNKYIMDEMIYAFTLNEEIANGYKEMYFPGLKNKMKPHKFQTEFLTRDEERRRVRGMKLFLKHYFSLWD